MSDVGVLDSARRKFFLEDKLKKKKKKAALALRKGDGGWTERKMDRMSRKTGVFSNQTVSL